MSETNTSSEQDRKRLEQYLQSRSAKPNIDSPEIARRAPDSVVPLTFAQQQIWLHAQLAPKSPLYNEPFTIYRRGPLEHAVLERSFSEIIRRHEAWRTNFPFVDGQPVQKVQPPSEIRLPSFDLRHLPHDQREKEALRLAEEDARVPFDLARGTLWRARVVCLDDEDYRLFITAHHMIFDGVTGYGVLLPELSAIYDAFASGRPSPLPAIPFQYGDYAVWQRQAFREQKQKLHMDFWRQQLRGRLPVLQLPTDRARPATQSFRGATLPFSLPASVTAGLKELSRRENATFFTILLAAFNTLLHRYCAQEDILIGSISAGRQQPRTERLLGFFLNTIALRTDLSGDPSFRELLSRTRTVVLDALSHDQVPLDQVVREVQPERDFSRNPLFQVLLSLEPSMESVEGWDLKPIEVETGTAKFDLCLVLDDRTDGLLGRMIYSTDLFDAATIERMVGHWRVLLEGILENPERRVSELPILTSEERDLQLLRWNDTARSYPATLAHEQFAAQAKKSPNGIAVKCGEQQLTYAELERRANQLGRHLRVLGVGPEVRVAICMERSVEMIVGMLAVLKAGGAYVPLDPAYPRERLEYMMADCDARVVLTQSRLSAALPVASRPVIFLDSDWSADEQSSELEPVATAEDLAYVIYTSGSTGGPKGVEVTHRNLAQSNHARLDYYRVPLSAYLLLSSFAFDSSVAVIFHALTTGATLVLPSLEFNYQSTQIADIVKRNQVSHLLLIPALYAELLENAAAADLDSLRTVIVAGETCSRQLVETHYALLGNTSLYNEYGPSEATVWASVFACEPNSGATSVPIGRPIPNARLYVLDRNRQPVPIGVAGELYIGGAGVARGYLERPQVSAERFMPDPFVEDAAARMYRTGDLARYLSDGNLEFLGRIDQQVKIRGLRIELGEIEANLAEHPDVREAAIISDLDNSDTRLIAYVIARQEYATSAAELRSFLKARLPGYMVPSTFLFVSSLLRTPNGKLDREALPIPIAEENERAAPVAPRDEAEQKLAGIWREVFEKDIPSVTQDFFELGGHSLLAANLLDRIEKEFGQPLSLAFVFEAPTIELMAEVLRRPQEALRSRAIIPIQAKGSRVPLFWIRGGPRFRLLAQRLGPDQPFLGLDLPFWEATKLRAPYRLEDIAAYLVRAMREVQPHGPYAIAGLCVNAVVAYEVAQQLMEQGEEVALLAMLDAHNQAFYKNPLTDGRYSGRIKYHITNLFQSEGKERPAYLAGLMDEARRKIERTVWQLSSDSGKNANGKPHNTDFVVHPAFHRYEPRPYAGKIVLLQSSDWPTGPYFDFQLGWRDLVRGIEFYRIPGNHPGMFIEPNVNRVAEILSQHLCQIGVQSPGEVWAAREKAAP